MFLVCIQALTIFELKRCNGWSGIERRSLACDDGGVVYLHLMPSCWHKGAKGMNWSLNWNRMERFTIAKSTELEKKRRVKLKCIIIRCGEGERVNSDCNHDSYGDGECADDEWLKPQAHLWSAAEQSKHCCTISCSQFTFDKYRRWCKKSEVLKLHSHVALGLIFGDAIRVSKSV